MGKLTSKTFAKQCLLSKVKHVLCFSRSAVLGDAFCLSVTENSVYSSVQRAFIAVLLSLGLDVLSPAQTQLLSESPDRFAGTEMFCLEKILLKCSGCCSLILNTTTAFQLFMYTEGLVFSDTQNLLKVYVPVGDGSKTEGAGLCWFASWKLQCRGLHMFP